MITAERLKKAIFSASENISRYAEDINNLNVFPVPDGDTGTNLALTLKGCAKAMANCPEGGAGAVADYAAGELLKCARGNSGVIFSLIFKGFAQAVNGLDCIDAVSLAKGLETGCNEAYAALEKPVEGTILTVIRIAASKAVSAAKKGLNASETFYAAVDGAKSSLKSTPNLLPILKKHGVIDAGGQGLVCIMEGMMNSPSEKEEEKITLIKARERFSDNQNIKFTYCTEFLIRGAKNTDTDGLRRFLSDIGDCCAAVEHSGIIKVHVHTNRPDKALAKGLEIGELSDIKIDNMHIQSELKAFNTEPFPEKNIAETEHTASKNFSGAVTYAAKDGNLNGKSFRKGQILGLEGDSIVFIGETPESTAVKTIMHLLEKSGKQKVSLIYGKDTDDYNAEKVVNTVLSQCGNIEVDYYKGGQPLYYYIISME